MRLSRRHLVQGSLAVAATAGARSVSAAPGPTVTPEMFGAKGDGVTNDTAAFTALSKHVNAQGGGTVMLRRATYIVGAQDQAFASGRDYAFMPADLLHFTGCTKPLAIQGNGATLKCADGLRFGTFDPVTGAATSHAMPFINLREVATPYQFMILIERCTGDVSIADIELDGNLPKLWIGGPHGDTGYQISGSGIFLRDNRGDEIIRNVHTHHHPQDGMMIDGIDDAKLARRARRRIDGVRSEYNARQGCSIVGGRGYAFSDCRFSHTGKAGLASAPGAGVDIEAEGTKQNRDFTFLRCEFANNTGCGLVADSGDSHGARFRFCTFIGTTMWSAWPKKPGFRFDRCRFVGSLVSCFGDPDPRRAAEFRDCIFSDDPGLSPTGEVYLEGRPDGSIADLAELSNARFIRCRFLADHGAVLPWSIKAIYADCTMRQSSKSTGYPRGTYLGRNVIVGAVDLSGSTIAGEVMLNGKRVSG